MAVARLTDRFQERAREWSVFVENTFETETSLIGFGRRDNQRVVLKVLKQPGDEWRSGEILEAFGGNGVVHVCEYVEGALLMERLAPGDSLVSMALNDRDEEATDILAGIIERMKSCDLPKACTTVQDWAKGFERYAATADERIPRYLVEEAQRLYADLCASQQRPRLLHGDLHHYNVLFDSVRGWLAIDPKGVVGSIEYEIGAVLRNPIERPDLFASPSTVERRLKQFASKLQLDLRRALDWSFTQAVLSAIWEIEDGFGLNATHPGLELANVIRLMRREHL